MLRVGKEVLKLNTFVALQGGITGIGRKIGTCFLLSAHSYFEILLATM